MSKKIGEGALAAAGRQGLKELAQALPAFADSNIRPVEEPNALGNITSREAYEQAHPEQTFEQVMDAQMRDAAKDAERGKDRGTDMG